MIERSAVRQWAGLDQLDRDVFEAIIARRDHYGFNGCITGGALVSPQIVRPLWQVVSPISGVTIDLIAMKEDLDP